MEEELKSTMIFQIVITLCVYLTGVYFHVKVIKISIKDKGMTWKLDLTNSFLLLVHHGHCVIMDIITYLIHDLHTYTGEWFCYTSKVINLYGKAYGEAHSLIISLLKYFIIVQWKHVRGFGQEKVKQWFFWINIVYPCVMMAIQLIIRPDFLLIHDAFQRTDQCLGDPNNNWGPNSNRTQIKRHTICKTLVEPLLEHYFAYTIYVLRIGICWTQFVFEYLVMWNIFEILAYCRIFAFMRR
jgi:hypothetical protein